MRSTTLGIVTLAAAGLILSGCGGDDPDPETSTSTSTDTSTSADEPTEDESEDDGGGEASDDLVAWAGELCGAIAPIQDSFMGGETPTEVPTEPSEIISQLQEQYASIGPVFGQARDAVESAGPPPIDGGDEVYDNMLSVLSTAADAFAEISDEIAALDPNDPDALQSLTPLFEGMTEEMGATSEELEAAFDQPEMEAAFDAAPECEGVDMT